MKKHTFVFTQYVHNCSEDNYLEWLDSVFNDDQVAWILAQVEMCPNSGLLHIQGMLKMSFAVRFNIIKDILGDQAHIEACKDPKASIAYCSKEDSRIDGPFEYGERPKYTPSEKAMSNKELLTKNVKELIDNDEVPLFSLQKLIINRGLYFNMEKPPIVEHVRGIWIIGPSGDGKSHYVHTFVDNVYEKLHNKWWDGFDASVHKNVLWDDINLSEKIFGGYFKHWADKYPIRGEIKGGMQYISYNNFYVTSQYSIDRVFDPQVDQELFDAIYRRFKCFYIERQGDISKLLPL